jgi:hypothetical protein
VLALLNHGDTRMAARKMGIEAEEIETLRQTINEAEGDMVVMFGGTLSVAARAIIAQMPHTRHRGACCCILCRSTITASACMIWD